MTGTGTAALDEEERGRLEELRRLLCEDPPSAGPPPSDSTLRRFLVARKGDVGKAAKMYAAFAEYRRRVPLGSISEEDVGVGLGHRKTFLIPGADREGSPCFMTVMRRHIVRECPEGEAERYTEFSFQRIVRRLEREGHEQTVFIFDFDDFGWENLDTKTAAAILKQAQDYHPERLKKAILYKSPLLFWTLWKLITPLMDQKTMKKFVFCDSAADLAAHLVPERTPTTMGGRFPEAEWVPIEKA